MASGKPYRHKIQVEFTSNEPRQWFFHRGTAGHSWSQLDEATDGHGNPRNVVVTYLETPKEIVPPIVPKVGEWWRYRTTSVTHLVLAVDEAQNFVVLRHDEGHSNVPVAYSYTGFVAHWKRDS